MVQFFCFSTSLSSFRLWVVWNIVGIPASLCINKNRNSEFIHNSHLLISTALPILANLALNLSGQSLGTRVQVSVKFEIHFDTLSPKTNQSRKVILFFKKNLGENNLHCYINWK